MVTANHLPSPRRAATAFLQGVLVLIGLAVLTAMLWEPLLEGRNAHATLVQVYFHDPFLAYAYLASIPFFVALYQGFRVLAYAGQNQTISPAAVRALRTIKFCAFATAAAILAAAVYLRLAARANDDPAGALMLAMIAIFIALIMGAAAAVLQRVLQNAVDIKSENDLTV
ncbi:MAG TPA: DUF2975 domain-containing protein [Terriglobales bacterium]|nr:DUF2975 domain-containing protein [Terriglobales bacterium]